VCARIPGVEWIANTHYECAAKQSDIDILVDPTEDTTLFDLGAIRYKLRHLLGVPVDLLTPGALPDQFRDAVLSDAEPI
jgi:uncharacterized protein